jgi:putative ABC transport system substrate-binding protein
VVARLPELASDLVALKPDVILAGSLSSILAARNATTTIPLIFLIIEDPVALGLVSSITKPGGHITGVWMFGDDSLIAKRVEFLKHVVPGLARIGLIINPDDQTDTIYLQHLPTTALALGVDLSVFKARTVAEIEMVFTAARRDGMQALFVSQSPLFTSNRTQVTALATSVRLPAIYGFREYAEAGGLMSYGANLPDVYRLIDKIVRGTSPADLPVEVPTRFELIVNLKASKAIGLKISDAFLSVADEVIE